MTALYKLTEQQRELKELAESSENPEDFADTFEALAGEFNEKAVSVTYVIQNMDSDIEAIDLEIKRLAERKKVKQNKSDSIREYLRSNMEANGITKIDCPLFSLTLAKGRDIVAIDNEEIIPDELMETTVTIKPNKAEILRQLKSGVDIPGARIEKSKSSLRIK